MHVSSGALALSVVLSPLNGSVKGRARAVGDLHGSPMTTTFSVFAPSAVWMVLVSALRKSDVSQMHGVQQWCRYPEAVPPARLLMV